MNMQAILNMSPLPKASKRCQGFSESNINNQCPSKRTSYSDILTDKPSRAPPTRMDFLNLQVSLDDIISAVQSKPSVTSLPPISSPRREVAAVGSRPNPPSLPSIFHPLKKAAVAGWSQKPPYLPSAETRMSLEYICSDRALPPVSCACTTALTAQLVFNVPNEPAAAQDDPRMSTDLNLNSPTPQPFEDYVPPKLVVSPATFDDFKQLCLEQLEAYDYIDIVAPASLRSARVAFANNFEIITFDLSNIPDGDFYEIAPQAGWLIITSSCPRQLIVKDKLGRSTRAGSITPFDFREVMKSIGFRPKAKSEADGMYWIWEKDTFDGLSWAWQLPQED